MKMPLLDDQLDDQLDDHLEKFAKLFVFFLKNPC